MRMAPYDLSDATSLFVGAEMFLERQTMLVVGEQQAEGVGQTEGRRSLWVAEDFTKCRALGARLHFHEPRSTLSVCHEPSHGLPRT